MKYSALKKLCFWLMLLALPAFALAVTPQNALFLKGNDFYAKGQYKEAIAAYRALVDSGYQSAAVYFNLGNASYKNNDIASAVLYLEKARKLSPGDEDINYNLKYVNLKTTDKIIAVPDFILTQWWHAFILSFSTGVLAWWSIAFILGGSAALIFYFFAGTASAKRFSFYAAAGFLFSGVLMLFAAGRQESYFADDHQAVVFTYAINVKSAPAENSNTLFVIHSGTKLEVLESDNDWIKIGLANGNEGWIKSPDVKTI